MQLELYDVGIKCAQFAISMLTKLRDPLGTADGLRILGAAYLDLSNYELAETVLNQALKIFKDYEHMLGQAEVSELLGRLYQSLGNVNAAMRFTNAAGKLYQALNNDAAVEKLEA